MKTSVFIPTKNPGAAIIDMIDALINQSAPPGEIILIDSSSTDGSVELLRKKYHYILDKILHIHQIPANDFGHGKTRNMAVKLAIGDVIIFLTQDVIVNDRTFIQNLIAPLERDESGQLVATFARQSPHPDHHPLEKFFYRFYFPNHDIPHAKIQGRELVMADIFFSNAASCIRREALIRFPFDENIIMCEDQKFALDVLENDYQILYVAKAVVTHSHNYSFKETYRRYFDSAIAFSHIVSKPNSNMFLVGARYMYRELLFIFTHNPLWIFRYIKINIAKISATLMAIIVSVFPHIFTAKILKKMSLHGYFWDTYVPENKKENKLVKNAQFKYFLSACAMVKNEELYIKHWLDFHIKLGFEHFYIYDNGSTDATNTVLQEYIERGLVTLINWPHRPGQNAAHDHCCKTYKNESRWIGMFDIDEYLAELSNVSIIDFLKKHNNIPGLGIHWALFGSGGKEFYERNPYYDRFIHRGIKCTPRNEWIKSIVNPRKVSNVIDPHFCIYKNNEFTVDTLLKQIVNTSIALPTWNLFRFNHYAVRSKEEFKQKIDKGNCLHTPENPILYNWSFFERDNRNQVIDLKMSTDAPQFKNYLIADEIENSQTFLSCTKQNNKTKISRFDFKQYLAQNQDLTKYWRGPIRARIHYHFFGKKENRPAPYKHDQLIVFLHIVKTAGTTFRTWLYSHFDKSQILSLYEETTPFGFEQRSFKSKKEIKKFLAELSTEEKNNIKCIAGHLAYVGIHTFFPDKEVVYVTVIREPLSLIESLYAHVRTRLTKIKTLPFRQWVVPESPLYRHLCYVLGVDEKQYSSNEQIHKLYKLARERIHILHTETLKNDILSFSKYVPVLDTKRPLQSLNTREDFDTRNRTNTSYLKTEHILYALPYLEKDIYLYKTIMADIVQSTSKSPHDSADRL